MSTYKNISGDWTITVEGGIGTIFIEGNLDVAGNITYVSDIAVNDAFIRVAANNTGTVQDMGLIATKDQTHWAGLRFDVGTNQWQISPSVDANGTAITPYTQIATGNATVAGSNTQIQFNDSSAFGATANLTFDKATNQLTLAGHEVYGNIGATPSYAGNGVAVYNNTIGSGGTGLYVKNASIDDELVSKSKAIVFAIIF